MRFFLDSRPLGEKAEMKRALMRTLQRLTLVSVAASVFTLHVSPGLALAAGTAPNTVISNTATATYQDGNGTTYNTSSNTVTTTVQNAPSLTITPPTPQAVAPGQVVVDTYTLTNTGNASGNFSLPTAFPATIGANGTFAGTGNIYVIAGSAVCTATGPCTLATANTELAKAFATVGPGASIAVGIEYTVNSTDVAGNTIPTTLTANITQPASGAAPAATSANVTGTVTDTALAQARLDIQKSVVSPTIPSAAPATAAQDIAFTINANNGGGFAATDLQSVKTLLGSANPGVLVSDLIPQFGGVPLNLDTTNAAPSVTLNGAIAGATATLYYSTSSSAAAGSWTTTYAPGDYFIGVLVSGGAGGQELPSKTAQSSGAGAVTTPQVTLKFSVLQPVGTGSANTNSVTNLANAVIGGNPGASGVTPVIGPFAGSGEADSSNPTTPITGAVNNATPSSGAAAPGGASNQVGSQAFASNQVVTGPLNFSGATGSYPAAPNNGSAAPTNNLDYTAAGFVCANGSAVNDGTTKCVIPPGGITLPGTYANTGNASDTLSIAVTAPAGFTAQAFAATGCAASITTLNTTSCVKGAALTPVAASGTTANGTLGTVASSGSGNYLVVYLPTTPGTSSVNPFTASDSIVTVAGSQGGTVAADTNNTHFDLYPGGAIQLTKSAAVVSNCPAGSSGQTAGAPCPGGTITYTVTYLNTAPAAAYAGGSNVGTEPGFAYNAIVTGTGAGALVINEDGTPNGDPNAKTNNWASFTNGLTGAPTTTGTTTFTFAYNPTAGTAAGSSKFTATANSAIPAGAAGTVVFSAIVK